MGFGRPHNSYPDSNNRCSSRALRSVRGHLISPMNKCKKVLPSIRLIVENSSHVERRLNAQSES